MKIQDKDFYYGAVLAQIAQYPTFTSINQVTEKEGAYQINNSYILIKYANASNNKWRFTFRQDDFKCFSNSRHPPFKNCFIVLVCAGTLIPSTLFGHTICLLSNSDIKEILNKDSNDSQWISVSYSNGSQWIIR